MRAVVYDGLSARSHPATVDVDLGGLTVALDDGRTEHIPFARLARGDSRPDRTVIVRDDAPDWRLVIAEPVPWLASVRQAGRMPQRTAIAYGAGAAGLVGLVFVVWLTGGRLLDLAAPLIPHRVLEPIGAAVAKQLGDGEVCTTPEGQAALTHLLARLRPAEGFVEPVKIDVVNVDAVNALALPGGHIVVFNGLIEQAKTSDELAGVLAHELTHVQLRHPTKALIRVVGVIGFLEALMGSTPGQFAGEALMMSQSRDAERAADTGALTLMSQAKISPSGMADFFKRMMVKHSHKAGKNADDWIDSVSSFLATHPGDEERFSTIDAAARKAGVTEPAMSAGDWDAVNQMCDHDD